MNPGSRFIGSVKRVRERLRRPRFLDVVLVFLILALSTLTVVYEVSVEPEIRDFTRLNEHVGQRVQVVGVVLSSRFDPVANDAEIDLYGLGGGMCTVYIEYVEDVRTMENLDINRIIAITGSVERYGGDYVLNGPNDNTLRIRGEYRPELMSINSASNNGTGMYLAVEGVITGVRMSSGAIKGMSLKDATGIIDAWFDFRIPTIPIGSIVKIYGLMQRSDYGPYIQVYSQDAIIVTSYYNATGPTPIAALLADPLGHIDRDLYVEGYVTYTPTVYSGTVEMYIGDEDGSDFTYPAHMIKLRFYGVGEGGGAWAKGDALSISHCILEYDEQGGEYMLTASADKGAVITVKSRHGPWSPPIGVLCERPKLFEGVDLNLTCQVSRWINESACLVSEPESNYTVLLYCNVVGGMGGMDGTPPEGAFIRVAGRFEYMEGEGRYAIIASAIETLEV